MGRHQHYVARGYQRGFADGERIILVDKLNRTRKEVGIRHAFVARSHSTFADSKGQLRDEVDEEWGRIENMSIRNMRRVTDTNANLDVEATAAIKAIAALHFARSESIRDAALRFEPEFIDDYARQAESDEQLKQMFRKEYGRESREGELQELVLVRGEFMVDSNLSQVDRMLHIYNTSLEIFEPFYVQIIRPMKGQSGFSFCDSPLVNHCRKTGKTGPRDGLAIGDSDLLLIPLGRYICAALTAEQDPHVTISPSLVEYINHLTWESAVRFVAYHPKEHPGGVIPDFANWIAGANGIG
ncbi:MAG: DUF4238 domain-containing protein [Acidimicrobiia bacterium]|nr:DUF4238 domain-containing protein [Acidimicrobiia bacterium]MCY4434047.1 DUF4238 domain-containing protein [bacterium]